MGDNINMELVKGSSFLSRQELAFLLGVIHRTLHVNTKQGLARVLSDIAQIIPLHRIAAVAGKIDFRGRVDKILKTIEHGPVGWLRDYCASIDPDNPSAALQRLLESNGGGTKASSLAAPSECSANVGYTYNGLLPNSVVIGSTADRLSIRSAFLYIGQEIIDWASYVPILEHLTPHFHSALLRATFNIEDNKYLSEREKEVLHWVGSGKTSWETACILQISERTAVFHIQNAMKKLGVTKRSQAVAQAVALGLIDLH